MKLGLLLHEECVRELLLLLRETWSLVARRVCSRIVVVVVVFVVAAAA